MKINNKPHTKEKIKSDYKENLNLDIKTMNLHLIIVTQIYLWLLLNNNKVGLQNLVHN